MTKPLAANMIIVNIGGEKYAWPMCGNGRLCDPGLKFHTEHPIDETEVCFTSFSPRDGEFIELTRYIFMKGTEKITAKKILEKGGLLQKFIDHMHREFEKTREGTNFVAAPVEEKKNDTVDSERK